MELGGKSPFVVFADADLERALDAAVFMIFSNNGERCTAGSRILVERSHLRRLRRSASSSGRGASASAIRSTSKTIVGPMISRGHLEKVRSYIALGSEEGATLLCGGLDAPDAAGAAQRAATTCCRPSSPTSTTACASPRRRSSARSPA